MNSPRPPFVGKSVADFAARAMQERCQSLRLRLNRHAFYGVDDYRNLQQIS